jgi:1,4-dihydroxy-2-naphthoate polyprenyltransferase
VSILLVCLVLLGAISAHISVNTWNEYYDFISGLDLKTEKTPFSGGSGALPSHPESADSVRRLALMSLLFTIVIGVYFMLIGGGHILPIGIVGVVLILAYTQWINRFPWLCLIAPGLGFGVLMVVGTHVILTGGYQQLPWRESLVPFFLINNLLLLNQYPDMDADASVGRNTLPIALGVDNSNLVYALFMLFAYASIMVFSLTGAFPKSSLIALGALPFSVYALFGAMRHGSRVQTELRYLAANVVAAMLAPLLLAISLLFVNANLF